MSHPIPVLCDCCGATGTAGEADFSALGDLLDFAPVPRKIERADGWTAEVQRNFIAALAYTGSPRRACAAVGKAQFGAEQLRKAKGNESFLAAWDQAIAFSREKDGTRLAAGLAVVHKEHAAWRPAAGPWSRAASRQPAPAHAGPAEQEDTPEAGLEWLGRLVEKYLIKVEQERTARLAGKIVAADFYLRQLTWIEVALDLTSGDGWRVIRDFRESGHDLIDIAETPMSRLLGEVRREKWAELGEPPRPEHPPRRYLEDHGRFSTEPLESTRGGLELSHKEQQQRFAEQHRQAAADQLAWEAAARRDYEERRARDASS